MIKFKVGDIVRLKSGGPWMTVYAIEPFKNKRKLTEVGKLSDVEDSINNETSIVCMWFKPDHQTYYAKFPKETLDLRKWYMGK